MKHIAALSLLCFFLLESCGRGAEPPATQISPTTTDPLPQILFDDFSYSTHQEMTANDWTLRDGSGWPGVSGTTFRTENISFVDYPNLAGNRLLRLTSSTDGTNENTYQTQICHQRKYLEGTYAARVRFSDTPASGIDRDQVVETFYTITPYAKPLDPAYSEMDNEYLPNGAGAARSLTFT